MSEKAIQETIFQLRTLTRNQLCLAEGVATAKMDQDQAEVFLKCAAAVRAEKGWE